MKPLYIIEIRPAHILPSMLNLDPNLRRYTLSVDCDKRFGDVSGSRFHVVDRTEAIREIKKRIDRWNQGDRIAPSRWRRVTAKNLLLRSSIDVSKRDLGL